jgi:hypothetical protein
MNEGKRITRIKVKEIGHVPFIVDGAPCFTLLLCDDLANVFSNVVTLFRIFAHIQAPAINSTVLKKLRMTKKSSTRATTLNGHIGTFTLDIVTITIDRVQYLVSAAS